ncbi:anoctamin-8-like isoform X2 [Ptychodera flava]|uniref:anoctamin-8-like isoform X2 n=1 Tax=Ptychodera flava TaxID=63121 RepID=UPI00396A0ECB
MDFWRAVDEHISDQLTAKLFGKKFAKASKLVVANKLWQNTIPTKDCDIVMTFPEKTDDETLMWVLARLRSRSSEISVHVRHHSNAGVYGFYLTAAFDNLLKGAEDLGLRKKVKDEYGGGLKEFSCDEETIYDGVENQAEFFTSQERQEIVLFMLNNLRAEEGDKLGKVKFVEGQPIVPKLMSKGIIKEVFPLHQTEDLDELRKTWVQAVFRRQPLDKICAYFGVKIGMYFAWLGHYTVALVLPAFFGLFLWFYTGDDDVSQDRSFAIFALFNVVWATLYLEAWKRKGAELAYKWGTLDTKDELIDEPRPLYTGPLHISEITGRPEPYFAPWKRHVYRYCVTVPVMFLCVCVVVVSMLFCFELQEYINKKIASGDLPGWLRSFPLFPMFAWWMKQLPKILLAVMVGILEDIYKKVAYWLNDLENYRTEENYENHLIIKLIIGQFCNSFLALFYIAFYLQDMARLRQQLAALLITRQVIGNFKESLLPYLLERYKTIKMTYKLASEQIDEDTGEVKKTVADSKPASPKKKVSGLEELAPVDSSNDQQGNGSPQQLTQAEIEGSMKKYEGTFEDYLEMVIQFGYVVLFSSAFPMAGLCALANNLVEVRSDAFKLCWGMQRPFGQRVEDIGRWQDCMELMGVIAVVVNCSLLGVFGHVQRWFPDITVAGIVLFVVGMEHFILGMKFAIAYAIPDVPHWVSIEMAKLEFVRRTALKKMELEMAKSAKEASKEQAGKDKKENVSPVTKTWPPSSYGARDDKPKSPAAKKFE